MVKDTQKPENKKIEKPVELTMEEKIEEIELDSLRNYRIYNEFATKLNKKYAKTHKHGKYPIQQCPVELHPHQRIVFHRNDQPENPLPVYVSDHMIEFKKTLVPGKAYDLPEYIIYYLSKKGYPIWDWVEGKDGVRETKIVDKTPRFAIRTIYDEAK